MTHERRFLTTAAAGVTIETREDGGKTLTGYAAVFYRAGDSGTEFAPWPGWVERVMPGAFDEALKADDVRALFNHDNSLVLGRNQAGTLTLSVDEKGLRYSVDLPDTQTGRDVPVLVERGDITGSSFAFMTRGEDGQKVYEDKARNSYIRELRAVELFDVSPVTYPAYEGTSVAVRGAEIPDDVQAEVDRIAAETATHQCARRRQRLNLLRRA